MIIKRLDARYTKPDQMKALVIISPDEFNSMLDINIIQAVKKSKFNELASERGIVVIDRKNTRDITPDAYNSIN